MGKFKVGRKWIILALVLLAVAVGLLLRRAKIVPANEYYIDSINGSDANAGTSPAQPWKTLASIRSRSFKPGDVVRFRCGSNWSGELVIDDSGVAGKPITFTTYGHGERPVFTNRGSDDNWTNVVRIEADWVVVEGLLVQDAQKAGVLISTGADHNVVRDIEASNVGVGVWVEGEHNLVTGNYVHDLHMVNNTTNGNDDFGAVGIWLFNSNNEVSYNRMERCIAPSYDYGVDGGAVEWWGVVNNCYVHKNWATGCDGFLEVGGGSARDTVVAYNVSVDNGEFAYLHLSGNHASQVENLRVENNTIVDTKDYSEMKWVVFGFEGTPEPSTFLLRNNIFYVNDFWYVSDALRRGWNFTHDHNLYYLANPSSELGFHLGNAEKIANPQFVNLAGQDFHLLSGSPAIDAGVDLGYHTDLDGNAVPYGTAPDLGAFEYSGVAILSSLAGPTHAAASRPSTFTPTWTGTRMLTP